MVYQRDSRALLFWDQSLQERHAARPHVEGGPLLDRLDYAMSLGAPGAICPTLDDLAAKATEFGFDGAACVRSIRDFNETAANAPEALSPPRGGETRPMGEAPFRIIVVQPGITFTELTKVTKIERSATSRMVSQLIKGGLVKRTNSPNDARQFTLEITAAAEALAQVMPAELLLKLTGVAVPGADVEAVRAPADAHAAVAGGATFPAAWSTYEAGVAGWAGKIYTAKLTGITAPFSYTVTSCGQSTGPVAAAPPRAVGPTESTLVAVMADMGTVIPAGFLTAEQIEKDHAAEPFDLFVLAGDVSYATTDPPKDELEAVWDAYGRMVEPFTKFAPFMITVGNRS